MFSLYCGHARGCIIAAVGALCLIAPRPGYGQDNYVSYITQIFESREKDTRDFVIQEMENFLHWYPDGDNAASMCYLMGTILEEKGDRSHAVSALIKSALLYGKSDIARRAATDARAMLIKERHFNEHRQMYLELLDSDIASYGSLQDRWYNYLVALEKIGDKDLNSWIVKDAQQFLEQFPTFDKNDHITLNIAQAHDRQKNDKKAVSSYLKVERLFPQSQFVPYARLRQGILYYKELNKKEVALRIFDDLLADFPGDNYAPEAQFLSAELTEDKFKDMTGAVNRYLQMHRAYPNSPLTIEALFRATRILEDKLKDYSQAIATCQLIADVYTQAPEADKSLENAAKIYEDRLKDYNNAIEQRVRMSIVFPNSPRTVDNLMKAGDLAEKKLKDWQRAIEIYQVVAKDFALSARAKDAIKKIESLKKRLAEQ